jgi:hypothetical protein
MPYKSRSKGGNKLRVYVCNAEGTKTFRPKYAALGICDTAIQGSRVHMYVDTVSQGRLFRLSLVVLLAIWRQVAELLCPI